MMITEDDLERWQALCDAATPGPWKLWNGWGPAEDGKYRVCGIGPDNSGTGITASDWPASDVAGRAEDLEFVAIARTALPALIAEVRRLRNSVHSRVQVG